MHKRLKPETIVPNELYVKRQADKQLKQVIDDMGRPASILVARQMGKTNLLLNTKREYQDDNTIFIYIDLSTIDNDLRACFRYIIDTAIDTNLGIFEDIENDIVEFRTKNRLPQREHEQELLILLKKFGGKIVIVLDEIDSMTNFPFSDQFFSQIRSVYFASRTNYKEFYNLTYVLSGVLEPSEIIQDNTKSPFNISEKIYLNDFTKDEYLKFIKNINLTFFSVDIIEEIYNWTHGHPRMIWDICAKLEELYIENNNLDLSNVKEIINKLYLKQADTPPVDHIRTLVKKNYNVAQSLYDISQKVYINITDTMKNKLYLFGIIEINDEKEIKIKNNILKELLNEEFLKNIVYQSKSKYEVATELFDNNKYEEALVEYLRYLDENELGEHEKNISNSNVGLCLYYAENFDGALKFLNEVTFDKLKHPSNYYANENNKGLCYSSLNNNDVGLQIFKNNLEYDEPLSKARCYLNIANIYLKDIKRHNNELEDIFESAINILVNINSSVDVELKNEVLARIYYAKISFLEYNKVDEDILKLYNSILDLNIDLYKPTILLEMFLKTNTSIRVEEIFNFIKEKEIGLVIYNDALSFSRKTLYKYINVLLDENEIDLFNELLNYCVNFYKYSSKCSVLLECSLSTIEERNKNNTERVLLKAIDYYEIENKFSECYKNIYMYLAYIYYLRKELNDTIEYFQKSIEITNLNSDLDYNNYFLIDIIFDYINPKIDVKLAKNLFKQIEEKVLIKMPDEYEIFKVTLLDNKHKLIDNDEHKASISQECLRIINSNNISDISKIRKENINFIKFKHSQLLSETNKNILPTVDNTKIGRNDLCNCGSKKKYKKCCGKNKY